MSTIKLHLLPAEILIIIIQNLDLRDVRNLILTCKTLHNIIIKDNAIWRCISLTTFILHGKINKCSQSWYDRCRISQNWCQGRFKHQEFIGHNINYMPWLKYHDSTALLVTVGSELQCFPLDINGYPKRHIKWHLSMPKIRRYDKRTNDISRFVLKDNLLACGNRNGSAAVHIVNNIKSKPHSKWYIENCMLDGTVEVSAIDIFNNNGNIILVTGSIGCNVVFIWKADSQIAELPLSTHKYLDGALGVKCLALNETGDKLTIGPDGNSKPYLIDVNKSEVIMCPVLHANENEILQDIQWHDPNTVCYVSHSGVLKMMDIRTYGVVYQADDPFKAAFYCVKTDGHSAILAGTSQHGRCVLFDTRKPYHTQLYFTQVNRNSTPVYSVDFDSTKLIAAADRSVAVLDFSVSTLTPKRDYSHVYL